MTYQDTAQRRPIDLIMVEDSDVDAELVIDALLEAGLAADVRRTDDEPTFRAALDERLPDAILADWTLPKFSGRRALEIARERCPDVGVIFVSGTISEVFVSEVLRQGAIDYVYKHQLQRLGPVLMRAIDEARTQRSLRESEKKYRQLFESSRDALIVLMSPSWRFADANQAALRMFGADSKVDFTALGPWDVSPERQPDGRLSTEMAQEQIATALREGSHSFEWEHRRLNGETFPADILLTRIEADGQVLLQITVRDITERKRAEEHLARLYHKNELILCTAAEGILGLDLQGKHTFVNPAAARMLGYGVEELLGRPSHSTWHHTKPDGSPYPEEECKIYAAYRNEAVHRVFNEVFWSKNGASFPVEYVCTPIYEHRRVAGAVLTFADITERKRAEEELAQSMEQLRQSQKIEAVGRLAGGVAHDFNNLLTVITGYCELMMIRIGEGNPQLHDLREIGKAADRAAALTRQLLAFSRRQILQPKVLEIDTVVPEMDNMLRRLIGEDIDLVTILGAGAGKVKFDPGQIEQVIVNLVINSRDAMPDGGTITIETGNVELDEAYVRLHGGAWPGPHVMLAVSDTGCGMDPETLSKAFDPFFTTKEKGKGTGLGLSTVFGIVKQSGGCIYGYSEPGRGTAMKIYLPRVTGKTAPKDEKLDAGFDDRLNGSETILLVEDDETLRKLASTILEGYRYTVLSAGNGEEALQLLNDSPAIPHLLLTDVVMPKMSGRGLSDRVKAIHPGTRVLFMSGYTDNAIVHHGVLDQGVSYLQKPFTPKALARKVREVLDKKFS